MVKPEIVISGLDQGENNSDLEAATERLDKAQSYRDLSTVCVMPSRGKIQAKAAQAMWDLQSPMNQPFIRMVITGLEVGAAYTAALEQILEHPVLKDFRFLLTFEEDNVPPSNGLLALYESMDDYDVVGGLYWTKGPGGQPMIYGDASRPKVDMIPQRPVPNAVQPCYGVGMGFTLWKLDLFRDERLDRPYFITAQSRDPATGSTAWTQDLHACDRLVRLGAKLAVDTRVKVGHVDDTGKVW